MKVYASKGGKSIREVWEIETPDYLLYLHFTQKVTYFDVTIFNFIFYLVKLNLFT